MSDYELSEEEQEENTAEGEEISNTTAEDNSRSNNEEDAEQQTSLYEDILNSSVDIEQLIISRDNRIGRQDTYRNQPATSRDSNINVQETQIKAHSTPIIEENTDKGHLNPLYETSIIGKIKNLVFNRNIGEDSTNQDQNKQEKSEKERTKIGEQEEKESVENNIGREEIDRSRIQLQLTEKFMQGLAIATKENKKEYEFEKINFGEEDKNNSIDNDSSDPNKMALTTTQYQDIIPVCSDAKTLEEFLSIVELLEIDAKEDMKKPFFMIVKSKVKGAAFHAIKDKKIEDLTQLKIALITGLEEKTDATTAATKLVKIKQESGETLRDYINRIKIALAEVNKITIRENSNQDICKELLKNNDASAKATFESGIANINLKTIVIASKNKNFVDSYSFAINQEETNFPETKNVNNIKKENTDTKKDENEGERGRGQSKQHEKDNLNIGEEKQINCYKCGRKGHTAAKCYSNFSMEQARRWNMSRYRNNYYYRDFPNTYNSPYAQGRSMAYNPAYNSRIPANSYISYNSPQSFRPPNLTNYASNISASNDRSEANYSRREDNNRYNNTSNYQGNNSNSNREQNNTTNREPYNSYRNRDNNKNTNSKWENKSVRMMQNDVEWSDISPLEENEENNRNTN